MFKKKYLVVFFIFLISSILNAQPYYYLLNHKPIEGRARYTGDIYRINLNNPVIAETLMTNIYELGSPFSDEFGNWIAYEDNFRLTIMNVNNPTQKNIIATHSEGIRKFSYSNAVNRLVILYDGDYPNLEKMVLVDPTTLTISDTIPYNIGAEILTDRHANFSKNGDIMYVQSGDSVLLKPTIISYSLISKQIIGTKYIDALSYPGAYEFYFDFRRNGLGVIESWFDLPTPISYYNIYFLDKDSLSITIQRDDSQTWGNGFVANGGKYLLMFASVIPDSGSKSPLIGKIDIYDMTIGELKKTIQLPPDGKVMCFENYPNNVYYTKDIELPTRQVWVLNMDTLLNELDLTSLDPDTVNINSPSFTLTVKGIGFDTLSTVYFNDTAKTTNYISDSVLTAEISTADISTKGNYPVCVTDEWATSNTLTFIVTEKP